MYINKISLKNYRNLKKISLELNNGVNIFFGNNAQGKTNLLEAIYICSTGRSHRTHIDKELINFGNDEAHIQVYCNDDNILNKIDIHLKRNTKKGIALNNIPIRKMGELFGRINTVIFSPEDLNLIKLGPLERRKFMDMELCQINSVYYYNLQQYYKVLQQRNSLLKNIQKDNELKKTLFVWDNQLIELGTKLIKSRTSFISKINKISKKIHSEITEKKEELEIKYKPSVTIEEFKEKLEKSLEKDILYTSTSYGPHKDDIIFLINNINVRYFGSQGQQRTVSLSIKLAEINLIKEEKGVSPILLLDDVLSELDKSRQKYLISNIKDIQVIITCTGVEDIIKNLDKDCEIFNVKNGIITKAIKKV